jgi:hypothetical protein
MPHTLPASTFRNWLSTGTSAICGWISSVMRSSAEGLHLLRELRRGQAGADLLLEGQAADPRVLDAVDAHRVYPLADGGEGDRQRIHGESGVHPGADDGHLRLLRRRVDLPREGPVGEPRVGQLLGRGDDRHLELEDRLDLRPHLLEGRARAQDGDLRLRLPDGGGGVGPDLDARLLPVADHLAQVLAGLGEVDVHRGNDFEVLPGQKLAGDARPDRPEAHDHHLGRHGFGSLKIAPTPRGRAGPGGSYPLRGCLA